MTPVAVVESPLRRSDASRLFRASRSGAPEPEINDDEAERRIRRSATLDDVNASGGSGTVEANEHIKMCLQLYSDNKLSKDNAWSVTIIDAFSKLMSRHSDSLQNFQVAGSTLEASTKVYGLRVDSVHTDVMRMCSELTRQSARTMDNNRGEQDEDDDEDGTNKENDSSMAPGGDTPSQDPKPKKKRARKHASTITKNKETINAPLDTNPFTDPFFAKLNSVVGDVNSSSRLMQNIVPTVDGELRLRMDYQFWDDSEAPEVDLDAEEDYQDMELSSLTIHNVSKSCKLHTMLSGYVLTDAPAEDDSDDAPVLDSQGDAQVRDITTDAMELNRSALDVQFDMDAEVEPIPVGDAYIIDYASADAMGGPDADDDFNEDDQIALQNCRGLKRKPVVIEDMRPVDSSAANLEYSYRALDNISQFWAGPSHWKFKRSKGLRSVSLRFSNVNEEGQGRAGKPKEKVTRKKKRFDVDALDDIISVDEELFLGYNSNRPVKNITHQKSMICKKWDKNKLKLPTDYHLEKNRYNVNTFAQGLKVRDFDSEPELDAPMDDYSYDDPVDHRVMNDEADVDAAAGFGGGAGDDHQNFDDIAGTGESAGGPAGVASTTLNTSLDFIPTEFQGAPDKVTKINIAYAKTAKVVDMKQLKSCCWRLITEQITTSNPADAPSTSSSSPSAAPCEGKAKFSEIYRDLPFILSKSMSENISKSLAFYSVLHLSNERSLRLVRQDDLEDFQILPSV